MMKPGVRDYTGRGLRDTVPSPQACKHTVSSYTDGHKPPMES